MAQVRNISADELFVGHLQATVEPDELLEVPDVAFLDRTWHRDTWQLLQPPASGFDRSIDDAVWWSSTEPEPEPAVEELEDATPPAIDPPPLVPPPGDIDEHDDIKE